MRQTLRHTFSSGLIMFRPPLRGLAFAGLITLALASAAYAQDPVPRPPEPGVVVQDRGPIHEGFAQPGAQTRGKGMTAPKAPPPPVPELPPDQRPEGDNVQWVPGYWNWDTTRQDYTWVSGFWRNVPPNRAWQPGEWRKAGDQYQYVPGYWRPADGRRLATGLPEPPKSLENGPNGPAQNADSVWVPGGWVYKADGTYAWRPGYWAQPNGNQVWEPEQYVYNGNGYTNVPGYWDYCLEDRGLLYAPVAFNQPLWANSGWAYRPRYALGLGRGGYGGLFGSLYIGPGYNGYYYGGYGLGLGGYGYGGLLGGLFGPFGYGLGYYGFGLGFGYPGFGFGLGYGFGYPWYGFGYPWYGYGPGYGYRPWWTTGYGYANPLWRHYNYLNRTNPHWANGVRTGYAGHPQPGAVNTFPAGSRHHTALAGVGGQPLAHAARPPAVGQPTTAHAAHVRSANLIQPAGQVLQAQHAARPVTALSSPIGPRAGLTGPAASGQRFSAGQIPHTAAPAMRSPAGLPGGFAGMPGRSFAPQAGYAGVPYRPASPTFHGGFSPSPGGYRGPVGHVGGYSGGGYRGGGGGFHGGGGGHAGGGGGHGGGGHGGHR